MRVQKKELHRLRERTVNDDRVNGKRKPKRRNKKSYNTANNKSPRCTICDDRDDTLDIEDAAAAIL